MNYRVRLNAILNENEINLVKKLTEVRLSCPIDALTVRELIDINEFIPDSLPPETNVPKTQPALRSLAILIHRAKSY